jgi:hypothetical protein
MSNQSVFNFLTVIIRFSIIVFSLFLAATSDGPEQHFSTAGASN